MPAWAVAAIVFMCPVAGGTCSQQHLDGIEKRLCGKEIGTGWINDVGAVRVTVRCAK